MLKDQFEVTGHWLFRWRSYLPLMALGVFLFEEIGDIEYLGSDKVDPGWLVIVGIGLTVWLVAWILRKGTSCLDVAGR